MRRTQWIATLAGAASSTTAPVPERSIPRGHSRVAAPADQGAARRNAGWPRGAPERSAARHPLSRESSGDFTPRPLRRPCGGAGHADHQPTRFSRDAVPPRTAGAPVRNQILCRGGGSAKRCVELSAGGHLATRHVFRLEHPQLSHRRQRCPSPRAVRGGRRPRVVYPLNRHGVTPGAVPRAAAGCPRPILAPLRPRDSGPRRAFTRRGPPRRSVLRYAPFGVATSSPDACWMLTPRPVSRPHTSQAIAAKSPTPHTSALNVTYCWVAMCATM